jgi:hypothetical protein
MFWVGGSVAARPARTRPVPFQGRLQIHTSDEAAPWDGGVSDANRYRIQLVHNFSFTGSDQTFDVFLNADPNLKRMGGVASRANCSRDSESSMAKLEVILSGKDDRLVDWVLLRVETDLKFGMEILWAYDDDASMGKWAGDDAISRSVLDRACELWDQYGTSTHPHLAPPSSSQLASQGSASQDTDGSYVLSQNR